MNRNSNVRFHLTFFLILPYQKMRVCLLSLISSCNYFHMDGAGIEPTSSFTPEFATR
jgi:hypothetical protein